MIIALAQLGYPIIFFIVFGDVSGSLIEKAIGAGTFFSTRWFTHILLAVAMLYLILKKEIQQLKYANIFLFCIVSVFLIIFFAHYLTSDPQPERPMNLAKSKVSLQFFASLPTLISAYGFNPAFFAAYTSLKNRTGKNIMMSGGMAIITVFIVYVLASLIASRLYGEDIATNLLINISNESGVIPVVLQIIFLVIAVCHIPMIFFFGKESILIIFDEMTRKSYSQPSNKENTTCQQDKAEVENEKASEEINPDLEAPEYPVVKDEEERDESLEKPEENQEDLVSSQPKNTLPSSSKSVPHQNSNDNANVIDENSSNSEVTFIPNPKEYLSMKPIYYYTLTLGCYLLVVLLSIVVGNVQIIFGMIGATASSWGCFAGPGSFYIISVHKKKVAFSGFKSIILYISAWIFMLIGV